jgi:hypothetical protein
MIQFHTDHVEFSLAVAAALLAFACKDVTRPHMGVGIDEGCLCATDGHTALIFNNSQFEYVPTAKLVWSREHVEKSTKIAKACKEKVVSLYYRDVLETKSFPSLKAVLPTKEIVNLQEPIGINPGYFAAMALVSKACGDKPVRLTHAVSNREVLGFRIRDLARVIVMPVSLG